MLLRHARVGVETTPDELHAPSVAAARCCDTTSVNVRLSSALGPLQQRRSMLLKTQLRRHSRQGAKNTSVSHSAKAPQLRPKCPPNTDLSARCSSSSHAREKAAILHASCTTLQSTSCLDAAAIVPLNTVLGV